MITEFNLPRLEHLKNARQKVARYATRPRSEVSIESLGDIAHAEIQIAKEEALKATKIPHSFRIENVIHEVTAYLHQKKLNLALAGSFTLATALGTQALPWAIDLTRAKENETTAACEQAVMAQLPLMKDQPTQQELDDAKKACRNFAWRVLDAAEDENPLTNPRKLLGSAYMVGLIATGFGAVISWVSMLDYKRKIKASTLSSQIVDNSHN